MSFIQFMHLISVHYWTYLVKCVAAQRFHFNYHVHQNVKKKKKMQTIYTCANGFVRVNKSIPKFLGRVCHWDTETLTLNQIQFSYILQPCTKLKTKNPYPIPDSLSSRNSVTTTVQPKQNLLHVQIIQAIDQFHGK